MGRLEGRVAIVTGGARGIGPAIAEAFHGEDATVVIVDIDGSAAAATAERIADGGNPATSPTRRGSARSSPRSKLTAIGWTSS